MLTAHAADFAATLDSEENRSSGDVAFFTNTALKTGGPRSMKTSERPTRFSIARKYFDDPRSLCFERKESAVHLTPQELMHLMREQGYEIVDKFGW